MTMLCVGTAVIGSLQFSLTQLPSLVWFNKITPESVEATMMAFSASCVNLSRGTIPDMIGLAINK